MTPKQALREEKHGWDESGGVYHCSDGSHNSWWLSIAKTPQWEAWYKHASKNMLYDVDECLECGWMSEEHAKDFLNWIVSDALSSQAEAYGEREREIRDMQSALEKEIKNYESLPMLGATDPQMYQKHLGRIEGLTTAYCLLGGAALAIVREKFGEVKKTL